MFKKTALFSRDGFPNPVIDFCGKKNKLSKGSLGRVPVAGPGD